MIYFISDTHLNHDREFIWGPRGFKSVEEMNNTIITNWNETVSDEDTVYLVGDFFLGTDTEFVKKILESLNGKIIIIRGNHDTDAKVKIYEESTKVEKIVWADQIQYNGRVFYISHYPTITASLVSDPKHCVFNIYGHEHVKEKFYKGMPFMYNVTCDAQDCKPITIDEIIEDIDKEIKQCLSYLQN